MSQQQQQGEAFTRVVNWGQALHLEAVVANGGLTGAVDRIHQAFGPVIGSRNTFKTLFRSVDVPTNEVQRLRGWLLLLALAQDPAEWGMGDYEPPAAISQESLRDLGISASRCTRQFDFAAA